MVFHPITSIALSTGEAEMYAIHTTAARVTLELRVFTDATTGKALVTRRGLGRVGNIAVNELWLQGHVQSKTMGIIRSRTSSILQMFARNI